MENKEATTVEKTEPSTVAQQPTEPIVNINTDTVSQEPIAPQNKNGSKIAVMLLSIFLAITLITVSGLGYILFIGRSNSENETSYNLFSENGLVRVKSGEKWGYIDKSGSFVISPQFDSADDFYDGIAIVKQDKKYGYINSKGEYIISPQFENAFEFSNGVAAVKSGEKWGYIDKTGKFVINPQYDSAYSFSSTPELASVAIDGKFGFINLKGEYVVNPQFENTLDFSNGMAAVKSGGKWGYINEKGETVISYQYGDANSFRDDGYAIVMNTNKNLIIIDKSGKAITVGEFDAIDLEDNENVCRKDGCFNYASDEYCYTHEEETSTSICAALGCYNTAYYGDYCTTHNYLE